MPRVCSFTGCYEGAQYSSIVSRPSHDGGVYGDIFYWCEKHGPDFKTALVEKEGFKRQTAYGYEIVDLYQKNWPDGWVWDSETPPDIMSLRPSKIYKLMEDFPRVKNSETNLNFAEFYNKRLEENRRTVLVKISKDDVRHFKALCARYGWEVLHG